MYAAHFGLSEPPFAITPDPRYLYMSEAHREALAHLLYGIGEGGGFVQLTGEVGTGKTTLCRCLLEQLPPRVDVAFVLNPKVTDLELLTTICEELRLPLDAGATSRKHLVDALHHHLLDAHRQGRRTVLIIDEAQDLAPDVLEQIRLLTNLETSTEKLLQIILIGQPELIPLLEREDLRQVAQRVTARYHLLPVGRHDTRAYILHRLAIAGQKEPIFTEAAMREVHKAARGIPRLINSICDRALLGAFTQDRRQVDTATVRRAAREVLGATPRLLSFGSRRSVVAASLVAVALLVGVPVLLARGPAPSSRGSRLLSWLHRSTEVPAPDRAAPRASSAARLADGATSQSRAPEALPAALASPSEPRGAPTPAPSLAALLANPALRAEIQSAFRNLYALWGIDFDGGGSTLGCERALDEGLRCLFKTGTWTKLRRYDLPAILELSSPLGGRRYATVVALGPDRATVDVGGQAHTFTLSEIDRSWEGAFVLLWKPPRIGASSIKPGAQGKDVDWVRERLGAVDGIPATRGSSDVFDGALKARVVAFQRARSLIPDGIVGEETLIQLSTAQPDPGAPRLARTGS
jgi:general secretion pathway protein A